MKKNKNKLIAILGPTAAGKTKLAVRLASQFNGAIISVDSRQIYKGMDIGTGKDTQEYRVKRIPYHLINIIPPNEQLSLAQYQTLCYQKINEVLRRDQIPFLVGGTGLYAESILNNYQIPKVKPDLKLRNRLENLEVPELLQKLKQLDIYLYQTVDKKNKRRLVRAIEIATKNYNNKKITGYELPVADYLVIGIKKSKQELNALINKRVDVMIKNGLIEETEKLIKNYSENSAPSQTIGYQEIIDYLNKKTNLDQAVESIKLHTRQFAKRQMTWFRGMSKRHPKNKIQWVENNKQAKNLVNKFLQIQNRIYNP